MSGRKTSSYQRTLSLYSRSLFALADQQYEDVRISREQLTSIKQSLPFGLVPVLEVDGEQLAESQAINRYLARTFGFSGKTAIEEAIINSLADQYAEYRAHLLPYFLALLGFLPGDLNELKKETVPARDKFLGFLTKFLKKNSDSGFLVGNSLTWIDVLVAEHISDISMRVPDYLDGFPEVEAHMEKVRSNPKLKKWIDSRPQSAF
uniref:glutathione transferase n=1 Tax=Angiostrongylus cantonensis TaxID=6313 RepID=A0A0K0DFY1_ANGCA